MQKCFRSHSCTGSAQFLQLIQQWPALSALLCPYLEILRDYCNISIERYSKSTYLRIFVFTACQSSRVEVYVSMMSRLAPEVVAARQAMLDRCLVSIVQGPAPFNQAAPLLAFLAPPESHWQAGTGPGRRAAQGPAGAEETRAPGSGSSASSSRDTGPQYVLCLLPSFLQIPAAHTSRAAVRWKIFTYRFNARLCIAWVRHEADSLKMLPLQVWEPGQAVD